MANGNSANHNSSGGSSETRSPLADDDFSMHNGNVECLVVNGERVSTHHDEHDQEAHAISVERIARDWGVDNIDDVNAATAMLALKHGPKIFAETFHTGYVPSTLPVPLASSPRQFPEIFHFANFHFHRQNANNYVGAE